jgi:hypothetical protein
MPPATQSLRQSDHPKHCDPPSNYQGDSPVNHSSHFVQMIVKK